ncbi:MAG: YfcC family protein [Tissierellia bacterium]|nr:Na+/H+ antiporter NhaC family protein [Bacillota bacterium]NLL22312.1 YfcC family protein [Tissierellia bacterium]
MSRQTLSIDAKAYLSSLFILVALLVFAIVLTLFIPAGEYARIEMDGVERLVADSFHFVEKPRSSRALWIFAPVLLLFGEDGVVAIVISLFILFVGATFTILEKSGILSSIVSSIVGRFSKRPRLLIAALCFFFMAMGSVFGTFEEVIVLVPMILSLSISMGWDVYLGLGMSLLAVGFGFCSATFNPFTLGIAQELASLPRFSGLFFRVLIFLSVYVLLVGFLFRYARTLEEKKGATPLTVLKPESNPYILRARKIFSISLLLMLALMVASVFIDLLSLLLLPVIAVMFLITGILCGVVSRYNPGGVRKDVIQGILSVAPAIVLILLAMSVKYVITEAQVIDTILYYSYSLMQRLHPLSALLLLFALVLVLEFFISSGSAKALLIMPLAIPLSDLLGITRQSAVQAYLFGDGFSNVFYPTNAALLIALGFAGVSYGKYMRWSFSLQLAITVLSVGWLVVAHLIGYGPF